MLLSSDLWVSALIRRAELGGAFATVARKGDARAGTGRVGNAGCGPGPRRIDADAALPRPPDPDEQADGDPAWVEVVEIDPQFQRDPGDLSRIYVQGSGGSAVPLAVGRLIVGLGIVAYVLWRPQPRFMTVVLSMIAAGDEK